MGPFPPSNGNMHILVVDYVTKWMEAETERPRTTRAMALGAGKLSSYTIAGKIIDPGGSLSKAQVDQIETLASLDLSPGRMSQKNSLGHCTTHAASGSGISAVPQSLPRIKV
jgi:hypothetical protein